jgi:thioredoxin reductase (NADPH)
VPEELRGADLLARMRQQAVSFGAEYLQEPVIGIDLKSDPKTVYTNTLHLARTVFSADKFIHRAEKTSPGRYW